MRDAQSRMIINLSKTDQKTADILAAKIDIFTKTREYDKASHKLDKEGLQARDDFFENCDKMLEIYTPHFARLRRQKIGSKRGAVYQRSLAKIQRRGW